MGEGAGRPELGLELCVSRSRGPSRMAGGWSWSFPLPLPPPLMAAPVQLCQRQDWLFIHPLIVLIRDSNYPLRSSDYPELQEGDLSLSCCGRRQQHSLPAVAPGPRRPVPSRCSQGLHVKGPQGPHPKAQPLMSSRTSPWIIFVTVLSPQIRGLVLGISKQGEECGENQRNSSKCL